LESGSCGQVQFETGNKYLYLITLHNYDFNFRSTILKFRTFNFFERNTVHLFGLKQGTFCNL